MALRSVKRWWAEYDWRVALPRAMAQLCAESGMNPNAQSGVGAKGLAQFMDGTWGDMEKVAALGVKGHSPLEEGPAVEAYGYYMHTLHVFWRKIADLDERHWFSVGSYNAGPGNIQKARKRCGGDTWSQASACLVQVTGPAHTKETTGYVQKIQKWSR